VNDNIAIPDIKASSLVDLLSFTDGLNLTSPNDSVEIKYFKNNYNYRSDDFSPENSELSILSLGCSVTFGSGLHSEYTWPVMLKESLGHQKYASLATSGRPIEIILNDVQIYVKKFGKPLAIVVLLPDINRYYRVNQVNKMPTFQPLLLHHLPKVMEPSFPIRTQDQLNFTNTIVNKENLLYNVVNRLVQLQDYAKSINVPLVYSTWNLELRGYLSKNADIFHDFADYSVEDKEKFIYESSKTASTEFEKKFWINAADTRTNNPHPGIGEQKFYTKLFYDALVTRYPDKFAVKARF
jgi:hypothetical protein